MPCVDTLHVRCPWQIEVIVPRTIELVGDNEADVEARRVVVVASGELVEQVAHPSDPDLVVWHFVQPALTSAQHVAWAVGPFHSVELATTPRMRAHCLPGGEREAELEHSAAGILRKAALVYSEDVGTFPFPSYDVVFVDDSAAAAIGATDALVHAGAAISILSGNAVLHPPSAPIELALECRQILAVAVAQQYWGIAVIPKAWADTWLINGLALRMASLVMQRILGHNEHRYRLWRDVQRCCERDVRMPPICQPGIPSPPDPDVVDLINLKAPLVLHILDRKLVKLGSSKTSLARVVAELWISVVADRLPNNQLSTNVFFRTMRKMTGASANDFRVFTEQWVFGSGCPRLRISSVFKPKRMVIEVTIAQESPAFVAAQSAASWDEVAHLRPVQHFEGQMIMRVHEADGTPYEHVLEVRGAEKKLEVPFNTKYKRVRRNTRRYQDRKQAELAAAAGDVDAREDVGLIDHSFEYAPWEDETERKRWLVADWTDEAAETMKALTYEWIRVDADFEWIAEINFVQEDFLWISQLQSERDVVAQLEAVRALAGMPSAVVASQLAKTVLQRNYFYQVRAAAARALARVRGVAR